MSDGFTEIGRRLVQKWEGLVEDIDNKTLKVNTAILLENEAQKGGILVEDTQSGQSGGGPNWGQSIGAGDDIAPFQHYLLPLVRRVYPNLIANELVGVQPMTSPASLVFYLKYRYTGMVELSADHANPNASGDASLIDRAVNKGQTAAGTEYANFSGNTWNIDPYYSLQKVWRENAGTVTVTNASPGTGATLDLAAAHTLLAAPKIDTIPVDVRVTAVGANGEFVIFGASAVGSDGTPGTPTFSVVATSPGVTVTLNAGTATITSSTVDITAAIDFDAGFEVVDSAASVTYDYNMEGNRQLPEIELEVSSDPVTAQTRKLRTKWTIEASQDLRAMHNVDAEQELVALLANEVTAEIDREIINDLIINAVIRVDYDYSDPFLVGGQGLTGAAIPGATNFDDRNKALFYQILEVSNQIYRQSLRGAGNWIVTSPEVAAKLESLLEFKPDARTDFQYNLGIQFSGTLNGQFKVYKDPLFPTDLILVGFKGSSFMDSGFFYCPYIPLQLTPTVLDPESFNPRKGLVTRYGKVLVENGARMYGTIRVRNMTAIGANTLPGADLASDFVHLQQSSVEDVTSAISGQPLSGTELL